MASKPKSKQDEALQLLDDLDSLAPPDRSSAATGKGAASSGGNNEGEAAEVLAFFDEIAQKSVEPPRAPSTVHISRSGTPVGSLRKSTERASASSSQTSLNKVASGNAAVEAAKKPESQSVLQSGGGWGWGSVWSTASAAIQQAKTVVDEQVKQLPKNEQARKWGEGVMEYAKAAQLDKLGQDFKRVGLSTLTDILNVVAPPISEHEVIQVWLSHDMQGYDGIESLVYRALARIMEQVEGGDLIVNRGNESKPKEDMDTGRDLNIVEGYDAAVKLAQAEVAQLSKPSNVNTPTTYSHVYIRIQPFTTSYTVPVALSTEAASFLIYLFDPEHRLTHTTLTQASPVKWLSMWDQHDWVEDLIAETLRVGVEVVGQDYVVSRMGWGERGVISEAEDKEDIKTADESASLRMEGNEES
ncbi:maintenance of telomere capping protein 1 [Cyathus striatus]|nr:maintenance of telomere capping protein 1 [Cyathus striatus]